MNKKKDNAQNNAQVPATKKPSINEGAVRLTVDLPEFIHMRVRLKTIQEKITIKELIIKAINRYLEE